MPTKMTWKEICADSSLRDLPHRIEQDRFGRILMTPPPSFGHQCRRDNICRILSRLRPGYRVVPDCPVVTKGGVRVADVAAMPRAVAYAFRRRLALPEAPHICVEVLSPSNSPGEMDEKRVLYAEAGCREFWICGSDGRMRFLLGDGSVLRRSLLCPKFPLRVGLF
jgi:Uma2 family endonuclease